MSKQDASFETILDACLADTRAGRATLNDCLARHADYAAQLEPLLRVAASLQAAPGAALDDATRQRIEARLHDHVSRLPARRPAKTPLRLSLAGLLRQAATVALTVLVLSVVTGGALRASDSLPGEPLYSLKTLNETVEAWITPPHGLAEMHLRFARRRLDEVMHLGHMGIVDDLAIIQLESEIRQAMELLPGLPDDKRKAVTQDILTLTNRQRVVLAALRNYTPPVSQAGLEWGIDTATRRATQLETALEDKSP